MTARNCKQPPEIFCKKVVLKISQNSQENTCARVSFTISCKPQACKFFTKETLTQVFYCKFCKVFKNTYFEEHLRMAGSVLMIKQGIL